MYVCVCVLGDDDTERRWNNTPVFLEDTMYMSEDFGLGKFQIQIVLM